MEDLKIVGKQHHSCPFYVAKGLSQTSRVVFCPYNYVLGGKSLVSISLSSFVLISPGTGDLALTGSIVVLDEAQ